MPTSTDSLPGLILSKTRARWLLARNASENELFKKTSSMIDKAKWKEERAFQREKDQLLQHQSRTETVQTPLRYARFDFSQKRPQH